MVLELRYPSIPPTRELQLVLKMQKCWHGDHHDGIQELKAVFSIHPKYIPNRFSL